MPIATAAKVVDASAIAAILFAEAEADLVAAQLDAARRSGMRLVAPALLEFELANVCHIKCRRRPADAAITTAAFRQRSRFNIETALVDHDEVLVLARQTGLTAYDASYLWLARHLDAELVTLDRRLAQAFAEQPST